MIRVELRRGRWCGLGAASTRGVRTAWIHANAAIAVTSVASTQ